MLALFVAESPFTRVFQAGPLDASKTVFCQQSPILTCSKGGALEFGIQPRDKYNNKCEIEDIDGKSEKL